MALSSDSTAEDVSIETENPCIFDSVHGYIEIPDPRIKQIVDTKHVQRLRSLKQLGATYYVFPGASHNRFEHSLGVMHLSHKVITHLKQRHPKRITDDDVFCITSAGLLHDIGHGPFSHVFDNEFMPVANVNQAFRHEDMSVELVERLFTDNNIEIDPAHLLLIQALISPSTHEAVVKEYEAKGKAFLFEIVANERTGIDVDKWDYFLRDSKCIGIGISFKYERILQHMRIIENHICFAEKTSFSLYTMFRTRYELYKRVYSHKASKAIEYMICDILKHANEYFDIVGKTQNAQSYLELTDHILTQIEFEPERAGKKGLNGLRKAKQLIARLKWRQLYSCCGYLLLKPDIVATFNPKQSEEDALYETPEKDENKNSVNTKAKAYPKIEYKQIEKQWSLELFEMINEAQATQNNKENKDTRADITADDIKVQLMSLSFGMESEEFILYNSKNPKQCKYVHVDQVTTVAAGAFREVIVRVYCKNNEWKPDITNAWATFIRNKNLCDPQETEFSIFVSPKREKKPIESQSRKRKLDFSRSGTVSLMDMDTQQYTPPQPKKARHQ